MWIRGDGEVCDRAPVWADTGIHWIVVVACVIGVVCSRSVYAAMILVSLSFFVFNLCFTTIYVSPHGAKPSVGRLPHVM